MKPTLGRVVLFHQERTAKTELWVGLVCKVNEETVDLGGFKSNGQPFSAVNVPLFDEPQDSPGDWAMWPVVRGRPPKEDA